MGMTRLTILDTSSDGGIVEQKDIAFLTGKAQSIRIPAMSPDRSKKIR
jgi:hypothetical protein